MQVCTWAKYMCTSHKRALLFGPFLAAPNIDLSVHSRHGLKKARNPFWIQRLRIILSHKKALKFMRICINWQLTKCHTDDLRNSCKEEIS
jgi:hypothetical protein